MKCIRTENAVGHVLCHDMTQIIPGVSMGPRFRKGHVVTEEDIPVLLSMGKENVPVRLGDGAGHGARKRRGRASRGAVRQGKT